MNGIEHPAVRIMVCGAGDRGDEAAALIAVATLLPTLESGPLASLEVRRCDQLGVDDLHAVTGQAGFAIEGLRCIGRRWFSWLRRDSIA